MLIGTPLTKVTIDLSAGPFAIHTAHVSKAMAFVTVDVSTEEGTVRLHLGYDALANLAETLTGLLDDAMAL